MSTFTNKDLLHHHTSWISDDGIHHIIFLLEDDGSCSMRYKSGSVVSVTLILEAFKYVGFKTDFYYRTYAWKLFSLPCFALVVNIVP